MRRLGDSRRLLALTVALMVVLAACAGGAGDSGDFDEVTEGLGSGGGSATVTTTAGATASEEPPSGEDGGQAVEGDRLGDGGITPVALPTNIGRDIIFTAELTVAVSDVAGAGDEATRVIQQLGGFLFGQRTTGAPNPTSVLTFKVAPEDFQEALARLGEIGELRTQDVSASDVTERIVDLESRINTATASVERLRALLAQATDIKAIVELESELLVRETELETLRGTLRTLEDQVSLATIFLTLTEAEANPDMTVSVSIYPGHDAGASCPGDGGTVIESDTDATVCYEILNTGDTWLESFQLRDPVLDIDIDDLVVVFGDLDVAMEPGDSILLAAEVTPERDIRTRTTITANAVDEDGDDLGARPVTSTTTVFLETFDPGGFPTFMDGLEASWDVLVRLGQTLVLALGALIPFAWLPVIGWFVWRWARRRDTVPVTPDT